MAKTQVHFSVSLDGRPVPFEANAKLNGLSVGDGHALSLGQQRFSIEHPKAVPFSTNFFCWYGGKNLGDIKLGRAKGNLSIVFDTVPALLSIKGPEFARNITNGAPNSFEVPTDEYFIRADFKHGSITTNVTVELGDAKSVKLRSNLGALRISANQPDVKFRLLGANDSVLADGDLPIVVSELPEGKYKIEASDGNKTMGRFSNLEAGQTNDVNIRFRYGALSVTSVPMGAEVYSGDGRRIGTTPLFLRQLEPGTNQISIKLNEYETENFTVEVQDGETNVQTAKLVRTQYAVALRLARRSLALGDFETAVRAIQEALAIEPADESANSMFVEAKVGLGFKRVEAFEREKNVAAAVGELERILLIQGSNERAKRLLAEYRKLLAQNAEAHAEARLKRGAMMFDSLSSTVPFAGRFEKHYLKAKIPVASAKNAISGLLSPQFKVTEHKSDSETFYYEAEMEFMTALKTVAGKRQCVIVGSQSTDSETEVFFKVLEFKAEAVNKFSIGNLINAPVAVTFAPIIPEKDPHPEDKLQARVREGIAYVKGAIEQALGIGNVRSQ